MVLIVIAAALTGSNYSCAQNTERVEGTPARVASVSAQGSAARQTQEQTNLFSVPNSAKPGSLANRANYNPSPTPAMTFGRTALEINSALDPLTESFESCVIELETEYGRKSTGTIVSTEKGLIIGKRSELIGDIFYRNGSQKSRCRLLAFHRTNDLGLVAIDPIHLKDKTQIELGKIPESVISGTMVVSIAKHGLPSKLGIVSVLPTHFDVAQPKRNEGIDIGAPVSTWTVSKPFKTEFGTQFFSGLEVQRVYPESIAERARLLKGDLIQTVNGVRLFSQAELQKLANQLKVGQQVVIETIRDGETKRLSTRVESFTPKTIHDRWGGGPFSEKRFGFGRVICHDTVIKPHQCGGPVIDLHGNVVGINIARSMRVATFAIPIGDVQHFVERALERIRVTALSGK